MVIREAKKTFTLTLILLISPIVKVIPCECEILPFEFSKKISDEIFIGKVIKIERIEKKGIVYWKTTLEKISSWKGSNKNLIEIFGYTSCDFQFDIHHLNFLVYAIKNKENNFETSYCDRTGILNETNPQDEDLKLLQSNFTEIALKKSSRLKNILKWVIVTLIPLLFFIIIKYYQYRASISLF